MKIGKVPEVGGEGSYKKNKASSWENKDVLL